ncbi:PstS family phosphate ABC transporter substrate-binding protein, partial [Winslowiella iniecta]
RNGQPAVMPTTDNIRNGSYPYIRPLYIYVNKVPGKPLEPLTRAFLQQAISPQGQALVERSGYLPLSDAQLRQAQALVE